MKRKVFNSTVLGNRSTKDGLWISLKSSGLIMFSHDLSEIVKGKRVQFVQDADRPKDWFLEVTTDKLAIEVRESKLLKRCAVQAISICRAFRDSLKLSDGKVDVTLSSDPDTIEGGGKVICYPRRHGRAFWQEGSEGKSLRVAA